MYSDQTLFDEPTRAVMNVTSDPATLVISQLIPADSGGETNIYRYEITIINCIKIKDYHSSGINF